MSMEGLLLTVIGFTLFFIGGAIVIISSRRKTVCNFLWQNETASDTQGLPSMDYLFSLKHNSLLKGELSATKGPYKLYIYEYFGREVEPHQLSRSRIFHEEQMNTGTSSFKIELAGGTYCLSFSDYPRLETKFSVTECHDITPYEKWLGLGQTVLEVGIPVLITGLVALILIK